MKKLDRQRSRTEILELLKNDGKAKKRFWSRVKKGEGCWIWTDHKFWTGYGIFGYKNKLFGAHRVSYSLVKGDVGNLHVLHKCDNRPCVNPDHLFLGTIQDNIADRGAKGRTRVRPGKLLPKDIEGIIAAKPKWGEAPAIAKKFGISETYFYKVRRMAETSHQ
jgi:hypothetical protein